MRHTAALLAVACLALAGCSTDEPAPKPTTPAASVKAPKLSAEEQREACVEAWAVLLKENADADSDAAPAECDGVPAGDRLEAYVEGMSRRNQANRDEIAECLEDPSCTGVPIP